IDPSTLTFGATGKEKSLLRCKKKGKDVKVDKVKDGRKDLVCYFRPDLGGYKVGDVQAILNGSTVSGEKIVGSATLRIFRVSTKKTESWHERHNIDPRSKQYRPYKQHKLDGKDDDKRHKKDDDKRGKKDRDKDDD
ncbi:MAG: hypothetical protein ACREB3_07225, partial [Burkholderiales bacterium]